jgi:hypothetical protein
VEEDHHQITKLITRLDEANEETIIIVDEAHEFRNQYFARQKEEPSRAIDRIEAARERGAFVLADTGSAYSTNDQNLLSLLALVEDIDNRTDQMEESDENPELRLFRSSNNVLRFGYAHLLRMAQERGDVEDGDPYVHFGSEQQYIPTKVFPRTIEYVPQAFDLVDQAVRTETFSMAKKIFSHKCEGINEPPSGSRVDSLEHTALKAWLSSPRAFLQAIGRNTSTPSADSNAGQGDLFRGAVDATTASNGEAYNAPLKLSSETREEHLEPIRDRISEIANTGQDRKAIQLLDTIQEVRQRESGRKKVLIFVEL